ncbi:hypothetical protein [Natronospira bacteriovora]|uniref:Secreted protein n=1 Tax=Natronospira bacteriovora TaxID=3069753 RepID=A0ABU0W8V0_9GAMM|nr:hypothetical protein [Natronospira sp. AB-CW4]MDQ2070343.1 hypothetical protein [Natronospira sp. AB-CW4]
MQPVDTRRQLAAMMLSLLALVAFSGSVLADCVDALSEPSVGDCHEAAMVDCPHHHAGEACMEAADCHGGEEALIPGERKQDRDAQPDLLPLLPATGPPPTPVRISEHPRSPSYRLSQQQCYLACCRFLE